jgi:hypothetical protein
MLTDSHGYLFKYLLPELVQVGIVCARMSGCFDYDTRAERVPARAG